MKGSTADNAGLRKIASALQTLNAATRDLKLDNLTGQMQQISASLAPLEGLGKNNLVSFLNSLKKIPDVTKNLDVEKTDAFAASVRRVATAVQPLAVEMEKIAMGFSALPSKLQRFIQQAEKSGKTATAAAQGYRSMGDALGALNQKFNVGVILSGMKRLANLLADFVEKSNKYVEDVNLFQVALGEFADETFQYAQRAQDLMGIDAADFLRNVGIFQSIATGFGVASDKAYILSKNLTQLSYDIASFYNINTQDAFLKLQSAISGELEPVRRLGYAIDQASLQQVALNLGIQQSVRDMTQAEKAQLRYIAIMQQSGNVMGDMARTIHTPANAMRILSAQVELLGRSIGNVLVPMLMKALPYVIAFFKALRMLMDALGVFMGFTLPTIDYSGVGMKDFSTSAGGAADNLNKAAGAAKKLKDYVLGFDELNILKEPEDIGGGGGGAGIGGGVGGIDFPVEDYQYDFLDGLKERVDELVPKMLELLKWIAAIAAAIMAVKAVKWLVDFYNTLKKLFVLIAASKAFGILKAGLSTFLSVLARTGNPFKALGAGFKAMHAEALNTMSTFARFVIGIAAIAAACAIAFFAVKNLTIDILENGVSFQNLGTTLLWLIPVLGLLGAAIYVMLGPVGLIVGALAILGAGIAGVIAGYKEHNKELAVMGVFASNGGVPVGYLADRFDELTSSVISNAESIIANKEQMASLSASIDYGAGRLANLTAINWDTLENAQLILPLIREEYEKMAQAIAENIELAGNTIQTALIDLPQEAYEKAGTTLPALALATSEAVTGLSAEVLALNAEFNSLMEQLEADPNNTALQEQLRNVTTRLAELGGTSITAADEYSAAVSTMIPIDFSELIVEGDADATLENLNSLLNDITVSGTEAQSKLAESYAVLMENLDTITAGMSEVDAQAVRDTFAAAFEIESEKIMREQQTAIDLIRAGLTAQIDTMAQDVSAGWWDELWMGTEAAKQKAVSDFQAQFDSVFEAIDTAESAATAGQRFIDGLALGIVNGDTAAVQANADALGKLAVDALNTGIDAHSPSMATYESGGNFDEGFRLGIQDNGIYARAEARYLGQTTAESLQKGINEHAYKPVDAFKNMLNQMLALLQDFSNSVATAISQTLSNMASAFSATQLVGDSVMPGTMSVAAVPMLAGGGRVNSGQVFIANENGRPEMIGRFGNQAGVMNSDQIVDAVSRGVYEAVTDAVLNNADVFGANVVVKLGDREILEATQRAEREMGYQITKAPIR